VSAHREREKERDFLTIPGAALGLIRKSSAEEPGCFLVAYWNDSINMKGISTSHKSNTSSVPQGYGDSYSVLPWVMWGAVTSVEGYPTLANGALV
jgi:hypothetical protein